jgi:hypothetical protein
MKKGEQEVWEVEAVAIPTVDEMRKAYFEKGSVFFTFDGLGRVSLRVDELEEASIPPRMFVLTGLTEKPIPRCLPWLRPNEASVLRIVVACFPDDPSAKDIGEVTLLGIKKI